MLDTAVNYENETEVGEALRRSGLPRDEVVVASKIPGRHHAYDDAIASVRGSLERLGLERTSTSTSSTGPTRRRGSTSRRGARSYSSSRTAWSARSASPTSPRSTWPGSSTTPASPRRSTRSSCTRASRRPGCVRCTSGSACAPRRGARWASGARRSMSRPSRPPPRHTACPPARSSCAGTSSSARCRSPSPPTPSARRRTSTSSASSSPRRRCEAITGLGEDDGRLFGGDPDTHEEM